MVNEELNRDANRTMAGAAAALGGIFSFGWLYYYLLYQPRPQDNAFNLAVLAVVVGTFAVCMLIFSFHLAMSVAAITFLVEGVAVLLAISGFSGLFKFVHPYGVVVGALVTLLLVARVLLRK